MRLLCVLAHACLRSDAFVVY
uniref:Uncharacterized protein n=1 Tax=Rhizophora mucronata TaxID=61149 RepID=A0A2P2Q871_RHIMU